MELACGPFRVVAVRCGSPGIGFITWHVDSDGAHCMISGALNRPRRLFPKVRSIPSGRGSSSRDLSLRRAPRRPRVVPAAHVRGQSRSPESAPRGSGRGREGSDGPCLLLESSLLSFFAHHVGKQCAHIKTCTSHLYIKLAERSCDPPSLFAEQRLLDVDPRLISFREW